MSKSGNYIGGNSVIRDPAGPARLARKRRKTKKAEKERAYERRKLEEELAAFKPESFLIKSSKQDAEDGDFEPHG